MADLEIRPTMKFVLLRYALVGTLELAAAVWWVAGGGQTAIVALAAAILLNAWPLTRHLERQRVVCRLGGGQLRYEYGIFSTTVKTIPAAKIQDVTIQRSFLQRLCGVGNLQIQSAAETTGIQIVNVDDPEPAAQNILAAAGAGR